MKEFKVGDLVRKIKGYAFDGIVVAIFQNTKGETRIVAELENNGMLHIFNPEQLEIRHMNMLIWKTSQSENGSLSFEAETPLGIILIESYYIKGRQEYLIELPNVFICQASDLESAKEKAVQNLFKINQRLQKILNL